MVRLEAPPFQLRDSEIGKRNIEVWWFELSAVIFTESHGQVTLLETLYADRLPYRVKGYAGYVTRQPVLVAGRYSQFTLHQGAQFGAPDNHQQKHKKTFHIK